MHKTVDQLCTDVIALVKAATGLTTVIRGGENGPQPVGEYASLLLVSQEQNGMAAVVYSEINPVEYFGFDGNPSATPFNTAPFSPLDEVSVLVSQDVHYVFSLQIFRGTDPMELASKLFRFPQAPWGATWLTEKAIVVRSISDPTNTNYQVGQKWVKRSSQQIIVAASSEESRNVGIIEEATVVVNNAETHTVNR